MSPYVPCPSDQTGPLPGGRGARLDAGIDRGPALRIVVDGRQIDAYEGESVAAALLASGQRTLRTTSLLKEPRGLYCGIGLCFDCVMTIDGRPNVRACRMPVRDGLVVTTQAGEGTWTADDPARK